MFSNDIGSSCVAKGHLVQLSYKYLPSRLCKTWSKTIICSLCKDWYRHSWVVRVLRMIHRVLRYRLVMTVTFHPKIKDYHKIRKRTQKIGLGVIKFYLQRFSCFYYTYELSVAIFSSIRHNSTQWYYHSGDL